MNANLGSALNDKVTYPVFGRDPARWAACSPQARLSARSRPFLIAIGDHDYPYLIPQAERARATLVGLGTSPAWHRAVGNEHDSMVLRFGARDDNMTDAVVDFVMANRRP